MSGGDVGAGGTTRRRAGSPASAKNFSRPSAPTCSHRPGYGLVARLGLTDAKGNPRCATVRPADIVWSAEPI